MAPNAVGIFTTLDVASNGRREIKFATADVALEIAVRRKAYY